MTRFLHIGQEPIDPVVQSSGRPFSATAGAAITFLGIVRGEEAGQAIDGLDYEAFVPMAETQFHKLFDAIEQRWPMIESVRLIHRYGVVRAGEPSLWIELTAPHRPEAFAACQWLIDEMKQVVPIWKHVIPKPSS
ncbi:MAG: molybdenum cofactor biosynthesis protein MoaE [Verrucomicrobiales bacterium]|nr:molybdenum cofactor biosynthesis protein MoaE [Verrucomicrobiales bacterium]